MSSLDRSPDAETLRKEVARLERELAKAQAKSLKCAEARSRLRAGSTRARVTTANANWARAAEQRDRVSDRLDGAKSKLAALARGSCPVCLDGECETKSLRCGK